MLKITWTGARANLESAAMALTEILWPPADATSLIKEDPAATDVDSAWSLDAYFATMPDKSRLAALIDENGGVGDGERENLPDNIDWVAHSLEGLGIVKCGRFILYGIHDADKLPKDDGNITIRIDANEAFGTGHHPTTSGCLTLLDRFEGWAPKSVLDLGCGSAVLAIAAAKLWNRKVLASDIDQRSVEIAIQNLQQNDIADRVRVVKAEGFGHPIIAKAAPFDFVFANILAGPLEKLAPAMADNIGKNGRVMLAGLMTEQEEKIIKAYEAAGFRLINRLDQATWPVLLFIRL